VKTIEGTTPPPDPKSKLSSTPIARGKPTWKKHRFPRFDYKSEKSGGTETRDPRTIKELEEDKMCPDRDRKRSDAIST
jgi:hypothetical protein